MLDLDATDARSMEQQEGRFFHGYYRHYCYLPLYIFSGESAVLAVFQCRWGRGIVERFGRIRLSWPEVRSSSGPTRAFAGTRLALGVNVDYVMGLAKNDRLKSGRSDDSGEAMGHRRGCSRISATGATVDLGATRRRQGRVPGEKGARSHIPVDFGTPGGPRTLRRLLLRHGAA